MRKSLKLSLAAGFMLALALVIINWSPLQSQTPTPGEKMVKMEGKMMDNCQAMMDEKAKMLADAKVKESDLTAEIDRMNNAPASEQLSLLAAVVTHMQQHRTSVAEQTENMHNKMMTHMMQHMEMGEGSMAQCPMMKGKMDMGK